MRAFYTAIFGDKDDLKEPTVIDPTAQYICFTDKPVESKVWTVVVQEPELEPLKQSKWHKLHPPAVFDETVYVDGTGELMCDFNSVAKYAKNGMAFFRHPHRDCLYQEAAVVKRMGLADAEAVNVQLGVYKRYGMPMNWGLWGGGFIYRGKSEMIDLLMDFWWHEMEAFQFRDQVSLPYSLWRLGITPGEIEGDLWLNDLVKIHPHK